MASNTPNFDIIFMRDIIISLYLQLGFLFPISPDDFLL